jgi:hypothetical protein
MIPFFSTSSASGSGFWAELKVKVMQAMRKVRAVILMVSPIGMSDKLPACRGFRKRSV